MTMTEVKMHKYVFIVSRQDSMTVAVYASDFASAEALMKEQTDNIIDMMNDAGPVMEIEPVEDDGEDYPIIAEEDSWDEDEDDDWDEDDNDWVEDDYGWDEEDDDWGEEDDDDWDEEDDD